MTRFDLNPTSEEVAESLLGEKYQALETDWDGTNQAEWQKLVELRKQCQNYQSDADDSSDEESVEASDNENGQKNRRQPGGRFIKTKCDTDASLMISVDHIYDQKWSDVMKTF